MFKHQQDIVVRSTATRAVLVAIAAGAVLATAAEGGDCVQPTQDACPLPEAMPTYEPSGYELSGAYAPRFPDNPPADALPSSIHDLPAAGTIAPPVAVKPSDAGFSALTSFGTWRQYNAQALSQKIEASKALAPGELRAGKPVAASSPPLDLWTKVDVDELAGETARGIRTGVGADYKLSRSAKVGVSAEHADAPAGAPATTEPRAQDKFGAYVTVAPVPTLSVEARGQWETGYGVPSLAAGGIDTGGAEKASISIAPRVGKKFTLENGHALEPFVTLRNEFTLGAAEEGSATGLAESAGAGVTITSPQSYSLSVTTDVDNVTVPDKAALNGKVQLKVPLR